MNSPLFSIVMPIYNAEKTLNSAIDSILAQVYDNFELILVDDHSKDSSVLIGENYVKQDKRVKLLKQKKNCGAAKSMNLGIKHTKGLWVVIVDSDAIEPKDWLKKAAQIDKSNKFDAFGGGVLYPKQYAGYLSKIFYYAEQTAYPIVDATYSKENYSEPPIAGANMFIIRKIIIKEGNFDATIRAGYDRLYLTNLVERGYSVGYIADLKIKHPLYDYQSLSSFFSRSIFFMKWRNTYLSKSKIMNKPFKNSLIACMVIFLILLATLLYNGIFTTLVLLIVLSLLMFTLLTLRKSRTIPIKIAIGYTLIDTMKKVISITIYALRLQPSNVDWKKR